VVLAELATSLFRQGVAISATVGEPKNSRDLIVAPTLAIPNLEPDIDKPNIDVEHEKLHLGQGCVSMIAVHLDSIRGASASVQLDSDSVRPPKDT